MGTVLLVFGVPCGSLLDWPFSLRGPMGEPGRLSSTVDDESGFFETGENVCLFLGCFEACRQWRRRKGPFLLPLFSQWPLVRRAFFPFFFASALAGCRQFTKKALFPLLPFFWEGKYGVSMDRPVKIHSLLLGNSASRKQLRRTIFGSFCRIRVLYYRGGNLQRNRSKGGENQVRSRPVIRI